MNWVTMWTKMQTIDAYLLATAKQNLTIPFHNPANLDLFSRDMQQFANVSFSARVLQECGNGL